MITRRSMFGLIGGSAALLAAPSIVRVSSLMPVKAFVEAPLGWLPCDGRFVSKEIYSELFKAIGYNFGRRDPDGAFAVPSYRYRHFPDLEPKILARSDLVPGGPAGLIMATQ